MCIFECVDKLAKLVFFSLKIGVDINQCFSNFFSPGPSLHSKIASNRPSPPWIFFLSVLDELQGWWIAVFCIYDKKIYYKVYFFLIIGIYLIPQKKKYIYIFFTIDIPGISMDIFKIYLNIYLFKAFKPTQRNIIFACMYIFVSSMKYAYLQN